jgi:hypothetical protein
LTKVDLQVLSYNCAMGGSCNYQRAPNFVQLTKVQVEG